MPRQCKFFADNLEKSLNENLIIEVASCETNFFDPTIIDNEVTKPVNSIDMLLSPATLRALSRCSSPRNTPTPGALLEALGPVGVRGLDGEPDELRLADVGEGRELDEGVEGDLGRGV